MSDKNDKFWTIWYFGFFGFGFIQYIFGAMFWGGHRLHETYNLAMMAVTIHGTIFICCVVVAGAGLVYSSFTD